MRGTTQVSYCSKDGMGGWHCPTRSATQREPGFWRWLPTSSNTGLPSRFEERLSLWVSRAQPGPPEGDQAPRCIPLCPKHPACAWHPAGTQCLMNECRWGQGCGIGTLAPLPIGKQAKQRLLSLPGLWAGWCPEAKLSRGLARTRVPLSPPLCKGRAPQGPAAQWPVLRCSPFQPCSL